MLGLFDSYSLLVFVPVIVMITITVISKRVIEPIVFSTALAYFIKYNFKCVGPFIDGIYSIIRNESFSFIIVMLLCFGALIKIIKESNGINALIRFMEKRVKSKKISLIITYILGLSLFMDDYLNSLIVGTTMKNITDKFKVPREQISIVAITTGVPICMLAPISTWAVFIFGVLKVNGANISANLIGTHLKIVPFAIYPLVCIVGTLLLVLEILPKIMNLKRAYERAEKENLVVPKGNKVVEQLVNDDKGNILNFFMPILTLIGVSIIAGNVVIGVITSLVLTLLWLIISKQMNITDYVDTCIEGMSEMISPLVFMLFAFLFGQVLTEMGFATTVLRIIKPYLIGNIIPVLCFWIVALIVFGGVDVWAVIPLVIPVFLPLSEAFSINEYLTIGAVLSGISFGTQICFISESHILISETLDLKPAQQVMALMPYAIFYALITSIIYLILGFNI